MHKKRKWLSAGIIAVTAVVLMAGCSSGTESEKAEGSKSSSTDACIEINVEDVSTTASYYDTTVDGTDVEVFAVLASDGSVRLAMNTCQVCNGSPYAYFEQDGDEFVCQNCGNCFSSDEIGLISGGCNPVPITEDDYTEDDGVITVSSSFLEENAYRFTKWKQF